MNNSVPLSHTHTCTHTHHCLVFPLLGTSLIETEGFFPSQAKYSVGTRCLARPQSTKANQAGTTPTHGPNHPSTESPGRLSKDAVQGKARQPQQHRSIWPGRRLGWPLWGDEALCIMITPSQSQPCSGLPPSAAPESGTPGGLF